MWCALSPLPIVPGSRRTRKRSAWLCNLHTESCCHPDSCCEIPIPPMIFTDRLRRDRIRNEKSASRPESADLPHLAQSLFPRSNPAWAVRRDILPWIRQPVDSATVQVRAEVTLWGYARNRGEPHTAGDLTVGNSCGAGGPGRAGWGVSQGKNYSLADLNPRSHFRRSQTCHL